MHAGGALKKRKNTHTHISCSPHPQEFCRLFGLITDPATANRKGGFDLMFAGFKLVLRLRLHECFGTDLSSIQMELNRMMAKYYWKFSGKSALQTFWTTKNIMFLRRKVLQS